MKLPFFTPRRRADDAARPDMTKASATGRLIAFQSQGRPVWTPRDYSALAREGYAKNAIVYRAVRMIAEAAASVPWLLYDGAAEIDAHPLLALLARPNRRQAGRDLLEALYGHLLVAGNAYVEAVAISPSLGGGSAAAGDGEIRELHVLRPDRMKVVPAEIGLVGDNDFVFKISSDGSAWTEAIRIDKDTGLPTILYDNATSGLVATTMQDAIDEVAAGGGGGGGAVVSVFGRTGAVAAAASDYDASQVDNDSAVSGATVTNALETLGAAVAGKQDSDPDLIALAGVSSTGLLARTGAGTAAARSLVAGDGLTGSNFDGVAGNPTLDVGAGTGILANADDVAIDKASDANVRSAASNKVLTADLIESASAPVTLTDGASPSFDWDAGINREWTAAANRTCPNPTNVQIGTQRTILFKGNSGTTRTIGFGANFKGSLPTIEVTDTSWFLATFHAIAADHIVVGGRVAAP
jgi:hypothetical protein